MEGEGRGLVERGEVDAGEVEEGGVWRLRVRVGGVLVRGEREDAPLLVCERSW